MSVIPIFSEDDLLKAFDKSNKDRALSGDVLVIKNDICLTKDVIIDIPITIQLDIKQIDFKNHLIVHKNLVIC